MAYVAATDCTVTVLDKGTVGKKRRNYGTIVFDSTSLTYTATTGIPLPTFEKFGFMKQIDYMFFNSTSATTGAFVFKYDATNKSIRVYSIPAHTPTGTVSGTITALVFSGVAAAIQSLAEWTNNVALGAAVTLYFDAIGV